MLPLFVWLSVIAAAKPQAKATQVVVMDVQGDALPAAQRAILTTDIVKTINELGRLSAFSVSEMKEMVSFEQTRQLLGCQSNAACMAELAGAMGAAYTVNATLARNRTSAASGATNGLLLQLQLTDNAHAKVAGRVARALGEVNDLDAAGDIVVRATKALMRPVLALAPGTLELDVREEGATVRVDDELAGVTPLAPLTIGGGMHSVSVEKPGFIPFLRDVEVVPKQSSLVRVELRYSVEVAAQKAAAARRVRLIAWLSSAVAVGAVGTAGVLFGVAQGQAHRLDADIAAFDAQQLRSAPVADQLRRRDRDIAALDVGAVVGLVVGVGLAAAGIALFVTGDSPSRYDTLLSPSLGSNGAALSGRF